MSVKNISKERKNIMLKSFLSLLIIMPIHPCEDCL